MDLIKALPPEAILVGVQAENKWELLELMLDHIIAGIPEIHLEHLDREEIWRLLREREQRQSTGLGEGFAIPHVRLPSFRHLGMCLAILDEGIEFDAVDGRPVHLACMVLTNAEEPMLALKVLSKMSSVIACEVRRAELQAAGSSEEAHAFLSGQDLGMELAVHAEDLMIQFPFQVYSDTPISEVTHRMRLHRVAAAPVTDVDGKMLGEITSDLLFQYGMPDFFTQLQSVSFLRNFNPLEKYYEVEATATAGELMSRDYAEADRKDTLVEVMFQLTVKGHPMVYVIDAGKLAGVIGRMTMLDRAINF